MKVLGIAGGSGTGKSTVCRLMEEKYGAGIIDVDQIGHIVILRPKPAYQEILLAFGEQILDENLEIQRKKLGQLVFQDQQKLSILNAITFKHMGAEVRHQVQSMAAAGKSLCVIDCALLFEMGLQNICDDVWAMEAQQDTRVNRITQRDQISPAYALNRIQSQNEVTGDCKMIFNNGDIPQLEEQIEKYIETMKI